MTRVARTAAPLRAPDDQSDADRRVLRADARTLLYVSFPVLAGLLDLPLSGVGFEPVSRFTGEQVPDVLLSVVVLGMALLLLLRRRFPLQVVLATVAISCAVMLWIEGSQPLSCVLVAMYAAACHARRNFALPLLALAVGYAGLATVSTMTVYEGDIEPLDILAPTVTFVIFTVTAWGFGRLEATRSARTQVLADELARATAAAQAERQRIARELHDILAHSVSAMMMQAAGARAIAGSVAGDPPDEHLRPVVDALGTIESTGSQSLRELHRLLGVMRETATTDALDLDIALQSSNQPGLDDLEELIETPRRSGLIIELHRTGHRGTLDPSVGAAAYRVVQESLTNALKHAGRGAVVDIYESWEDAAVQLQIRSRAGSESALRPDTPGAGTGLRGLRERVQLAGGTFEAGQVGEEFVTTTRLPTRPPASGQPVTDELPRVRP